MNDIDKRALDSLSVAPAKPSGGTPPANTQADAGTDTSIEQRLKQDPDDVQARLDRGSDESMDASDPPSVALPGHSEPAPSSGFDADAEAARRG